MTSPSSPAMHASPLYVRVFHSPSKDLNINFPPVFRFAFVYLFLALFCELLLNIVFSILFLGMCFCATFMYSRPPSKKISVFPQVFQSTCYFYFVVLLKMLIIFGFTTVSCRTCFFSSLLLGLSLPVRALTSLSLSISFFLSVCMHVFFLLFSLVSRSMG